jgi:hypothetical protein
LASPAKNIGGINQALWEALHGGKVIAFAMVKSVAQENGWKFGWRLIKAPDISHSAGGMLRAEEILDAFGIDGSNHVRSLKGASLR